jgi:hypothetical protein
MTKVEALCMTGWESMTGLERMLLCNFVFISAINWFFVVLNQLRCRGCTSLPCPHCFPLIPLFGGLTGFIGFILVPSLRLYAWAPLLLDPGTLSLFVAVPALIRDCRRTSKGNLIAEYRARNSEKEVFLRLYRSNILIVEQLWQRNSMRMSMVGSWQTTDAGMSFSLGEGEALFLNDDGKLRQERGFPQYESDSEHSLADLSFEPV